MEQKLRQFTFYELYADILQGIDDTGAGKLISSICAYEFEDREPGEELSDKENFYWSNVADILQEVKERESAGKIPKKYNLQSRHFTFYETYYNAMKLMNICKRGVFVKAICAYMFGNEEPKFADRTIQGYFNLCKRKMDLSKRRKASGRTGGVQKKKVCAVSPIEDTTLTPQGIQADAPQEKLTYEDFRAAHSDIQGSLFGSAERYKSELDWSNVAARRATDEELKKERNIFRLARSYEQKYMQKP